MSRSLKNTGERSFTIQNAYHVDGCPTKFSHKDYTGRYQCAKPAQAASKAMTNLCHAKDVHGQCTLYLEIRETTQGSNHKVFNYHVKREKLADPVEVGGSKRMFRNIVLKALAPTEKCKRSHKSPGPMRGSTRRSTHRSRTHRSSTHHSTRRR